MYVQVKMVVKVEELFMKNSIQRQRLQGFYDFDFIVYSIYKKYNQISAPIIQEQNSLVKQNQHQSHCVMILRMPKDKYKSIKQTNIIFEVSIKNFMHSCNKILMLTQRNCI